MISYFFKVPGWILVVCGAIMLIPPATLIGIIWMLAGALLIFIGKLFYKKEKVIQESPYTKVYERTDGSKDIIVESEEIKM